MATGGIDNTSDEIIHIKCCICNKKNIKREAEKYCIQCQDYYCIPCADMHTMFLPTNVEHKLLDKGYFFTTGLVADLPSIPTQRCDIHPTKLLDMFCQDHDMICCSSCVALGHRSCQDIHSIPDEIDSLYNPTMYKDTTCQLQAVKKTMEDLKNAKENLITKLDQNKMKAVNDIRAFRKELETFLDILEAESIKDVDEIYRKIEADLNKEIAEVKEYCTRLEHSLGQLRESVGNKAQEYICMKFAENNIKQCKSMDKSLKSAITLNIYFQEDSNLRELQNDFQRLGQVSNKAQEKQVTACTAILSKEICVKHSTDVKKSRILGSCISNRWLLLSDSNNNKLKRVDISSGLIKDVLQFMECCNDICVTIEREDETEVAVSTYLNTILFVNIAEKMEVTKKIKLDHYCFGLACKNNKLFITDMAGTFFVHDFTGKLLLSVHSDKLGNPLFIQTRHVTISGDLVYISDFKKGLIVLDINGNYKFTYTDPALRSTQWVCSDRKGSLFVGGYNTKEIVQIDEMSKRVIGKFGKVEKKLSACFVPENKLVVAETENDRLKVYELD